MASSDRADEIKQLQRCMSDLISVLALPALWSGQEPRQIVKTFHDALMAMLNLDFLFTRARTEANGEPIEVLSAAPHYATRYGSDRIRRAVHRRLGNDPQQWPAEVRSRLGSRKITLVSLRLGIGAEVGIVLAGSERSDFPTQSERLLLGVAANQAAVGLQQALLLSEQKRVAVELDRRVAERTRELAETNEKLQLQVGLLQQIPVAAWTLKPHGTPDFVNQVWLEYTGQTRELVRSHPEAWMAAVHPDDREAASRSFWEGVRSGQGFAMETRVLRVQDGAWRWHLHRAVVLHDAEGKVLKFVGTSTDIDDRKRAEEELRRSEAGYRVVVETANDAVVSIDEHGAIILANPATKRIFGYNPEELIGKPLTVLMPKATRPLHETGFGRYLETGVRRLNWQGTELTALRASGEEFPVEVSFGEMAADGRKAFTGFIRDISEKKRAEGAVLASRRNLRLIIDTMPVLAWSAEPDGSVDFFNQRWLDYTGLSAAETLGWGWSKALHPEDFDRIAAYWRSVIGTGQPGEIEARLRKFDGSYRWFLFRENPLRDESGAIVKWYGTNTDIHDRKLAEEQVLRSEAFLAEAQRLTRVGSFSWRVASGEIKWSEQLYRIFELDPGTEMTLDLIASRVHPGDRPLLSDMIEKAGRAMAALEYEIRIQLSGGPLKYLHLVAHASPGHHDGVEYIGAIQDVTPRQLAEEALAAARSDLARAARTSSLAVLTASIAHEVNQPLSGIVTNASTCLRMLEGEHPNVDGARETARRTIRDGNRASDVVTRLRALFSTKEIAQEPIDLGDLAQEVLALSLSELQRNRVVLRQELADSLPPVRGDRIQLQQVIFNLVRNAVDAMSTVEDGLKHLVVRTGLEGEDVLLLVQDTGVGFAPKAADRLFESFYTTKADGMGIGLSVSRSIIEAHQGRLWAMRNDGPGATFAFSLPRDREGQGTARQL